MEKAIHLTFANTRRDFVTTLNKRVNEYFKSRQISRHGNSEMYVKTAFMLFLYLTPYTLMLTGVISGTVLVIASYLIMGFGIAGIGLSVMHDANHGSYSEKKWVNQMMGYTLNLMGASAFNWKMQHNVLHHTYTNVHDHDEDISPRGAMRFCPSTPWKKMHRYQFVYAWFLYCLMTLVWVISKDFARIINYHKSGLAKKQKANIVTEWTILVGTKLVYIGYMVAVPLLFTPILWWQWLTGFLLMHFVAGFNLAIIFQPAHVAEGTEYPLPNESNALENDWAVHQLMTTANFGNRNRLLNWCAGGLNFQIEHHLFPQVCHVHYRHIAEIVRSTAHEFGLPYKSFPTFMDALRGHGRMLKQLGLKPGVAMALKPEVAMAMN